MAKIKFGTSGWRAIIADEFTFANVRLATEAIGGYVRRRNDSPGLLVGYDTRFASEDFGQEVARVLSSQNIRVRLCSQAVPTPAVAFTVVQEKLDGAVNITASHNPGEYCGLKFSTPDGAPALPEVTQQIESDIEQLRQQESVYNEWTANPRLIEKINPTSEYLKMLSSKVDLPLIRRSVTNISYDPLYGTARGYLDKILVDFDIPVRTILNHRDVLFGGRSPEL